MTSLKKMKDEWKKLNEGTKDQYASGAVGALSQDSHSKDVKGVGRDEGAKAGRAEVGDGDAKFAASKGAPSNVVKGVNRKEGAAAGKAEVGEYGDLASFRNSVRAKLGLPNGINEPNKGLNK